MVILLLSHMVWVDVYLFAFLAQPRRALHQHHTQTWQKHYSRSTQQTTLTTQRNSETAGRKHYSYKHVQKCKTPGRMDVYYSKTSNVPATRKGEPYYDCFPLLAIHVAQ